MLDWVKPNLIIRSKVYGDLYTIRKISDRIVEYVTGGSDYLSTLEEYYVSANKSDSGSPAFKDCNERVVKIGDIIRHIGSRTLHTIDKSLGLENPMEDTKIHFVEGGWELYRDIKRKYTFVSYKKNKCAICKL